MPYAELDDLKARLDWTLSEEEERAGEAALEDLSALAAFYGKNWTDAAAPPLVKTIVLNAAQRYMRLIEGVIASRAGDEQLTWTDLRELTGRPFLDEEQQAMLAKLAGAAKTGFWSVPIQAYGTHGDLESPRTGVGFVRTSGTSEPFAFYADGDI